MSMTVKATSSLPLSSLDSPVLRVSCWGWNSGLGKELGGRQ